VPDARPLFLALALEAAPLGVVRLARPAWRRSAYVAALVVDPDRDTAGLVESGELPGLSLWKSRQASGSGGD
jgi:hypothetical protein